MPPDLPSNWTQQASNALKALARNALSQAKGSPDQWVNPTPLKSKLRYVTKVSYDLNVPPMEHFELYGARAGEVYRTEYFIIGDEARDYLFWCWFNEIRQSGNSTFVEQLTLSNEIGLWR